MSVEMVFNCGWYFRCSGLRKYTQLDSGGICSRNSDHILERGAGYCSTCGAIATPTTTQVGDLDELFDSDLVIPIDDESEDPARYSLNHTDYCIQLDERIGDITFNEVREKLKQDPATDPLLLKALDLLNQHYKRVEVCLGVWLECD